MSPGLTGERNLASSTPARSGRRPSLPLARTAMAPAWAMASIRITPGTIGLPGKCPGKKNSSGFIVQYASMLTPGFIEVTPSTKRKGRACGSSATSSALLSNGTGISCPCRGLQRLECSERSELAGPAMTWPVDSNSGSPRTVAGTSNRPVKRRRARCPHGAALQQRAGCTHLANGPPKTSRFQLRPPPEEGVFVTIRGPTPQRIQARPTRTFPLISSLPLPLRNGSFPSPNHTNNVCITRGYPPYPRVTPAGNFRARAPVRSVRPAPPPRDHHR